MIYENNYSFVEKQNNLEKSLKSIPKKHIIYNNYKSFWAKWVKINYSVDNETHILLKIHLFISPELYKRTGIYFVLQILQRLSFIGSKVCSQGMDGQQNQDKWLDTQPTH